MPTRWAIPLTGIDPGRVKLDHLHAVASGWVDDAHWTSPKPWSVRPMRVVDGVGVVEVATLTPGARDCLHAGVAEGRAVRLGGQHGRVVTGPQPMASIDWAELAEPTGATAWDVHYLTPTAFGNGSRFSPWPDPFPVARSLLQRWNAVHPDGAIEVEPTGWSKVWISDVDGRSQMLPLAGLTVSGFLGRVRYVCPDPVVAELFDRLLRFAEYAGIGRYTTRGLGVIRLEPTWPGDRKPATRR